MTGDRLFGKKGSVDWQSHKSKLDAQPADLTLWKTAFDDYFYERIKTRYLNPIKLISQAEDSCTDCSHVACTSHSPFYEGAGFAIVAIQCTLIEFFQTTILGVNFELGAKATYEELKNGTKQKYGLRLSEIIFTEFLLSQEPFASAFASPIPLATGFVASEFYKNVRCPILHEARTSNNWKIRPGVRDASKLIDFVDIGGEKLLYWRSFQFAIEDFLTAYEQRLCAETALQEALKRKLDGLCV